MLVILCITAYRLILLFTNKLLLIQTTDSTKRTLWSYGLTVRELHQLNHQYTFIKNEKHQMELSKSYIIFIHACCSVCATNQSY